jgi:glycosyltransferase involved in cell wall biosynthesis
MRAAIDCRYLRERPSGIGTYVRALIDRVPSLAPDDQFQLWAHPRAGRPLAAADNVREIVVRAEANSLSTLLWPARLAPLQDTDVVHFPYNILGRGIRCATVVTIHDVMWVTERELCEPSAFRRLYQAPFYRAGIRRALIRASRLVTVSEASADAVLALLPDAARRLRVIPHGVERRFRPATDPARVAERCALLGARPPFALAVGQDAPYKNHRGILEAFAAAELDPEVKLVFVHRLGQGALRRRAHELGVSERVVGLSELADDDVLALLQAALVLVQFSRAEGFGMPALEAMACGTPVIASTIPALAEVLGPAGVKVPLDVRALAEALGQVCGDASWREDLGAIGLERARDFDWDRSAAAHLEVYREAAGCGVALPTRVL